MNIAYLMPTYPMPSQTFIRREVIALEVLGLTVHRFAARRFAGELTDTADRAEEARTSYLLDAGLRGLLWALVGDAIGRTRDWFAALTTTVHLGRCSERGVIRHLIYLAEACLLRKRLARLGVTHLHVHFGTNAATVALLCHRLGGPRYSVTIHGPEEFDGPRQLALRDKVHDAALVIAISQFTRSQLYRWTDATDWCKIHVVHCGLDELFLTAEHVPVPERPRLVNIGRLSEQKGQLLLIEAAVLLRAQKLDFELVIVGDGPLRDELERLINEHGLQNQVWITGFLDNHGVRRELEAARALVMPSFAEGLPVVIMEALALGRPVISTYVAGIPELVEPGRHGWLVPAGAVEPLASAMAEALRAQTIDLETMGRAGMTQVAKDHSVSTEARKLNELLVDVARVPRTKSVDVTAAPAMTTRQAVGT